MGKRKSKARVMKKATNKVATQFDCPFCNHSDTCDVKIDRQKKLGVVSCRICAAKYQMECHYLHAPIDVYSEWIDACEDVNNSSKPSASQPGRGGAAERKNAELGLGLGDDDLSDDDF